MKQRRTAKSKTKQTIGNWDLQPRRLENGFDHVHLAGVLDGRYTSCNTELRKMCSCYGCRHYEQVPGLDAQIVDRRKGGIHFSAAAKGGAHMPARSNVKPQAAKADVTRREPFSLLPEGLSLSAWFAALSRSGAPEDTSGV